MMLAAALSYTERGWAVFPLHTPQDGGCSCRKPDCTAIGKHPRIRNGLSDATTDLRKIEPWFTRWPEANIGVRTGIMSGVVVIDVDNNSGKHGGSNLAALAAPFGGMPATLTATTGYGEHLYFKHPGMSIKNSAGRLAEGVDVKADGGYVVAAPSLHANGTRYAWVGPAQPLAELPDWLLTLLITKEENKMTIVEIGPGQSSDPFVNEGQRNNKLHKLGSALRGQQGLDHAAIAFILLTYNVEKCRPPLHASEVLAIANSVCQYPPVNTTNKSGSRLERNPLYWFPFNTRDWLSDQDIDIMTDYQTGWCIRLLVHAWNNGGFLPADPDRLWKLARARSRKFFERHCGLVLAAYQEVVIGGVPMLKHARMALDYVNTLEKWMQQKAAGEKREAMRLAAIEQRDQLGPANASPERVLK